MAGITCSSNFPTTPGAFDTKLQRTYADVFVAKLNPAGSGLIYATFLGGSDDRLVATPSPWTGRAVPT